MPGTPPPVPTSSTSSPAAIAFEKARVSTMSRLTKFLIGRMSREIQLFVPAPEQAAIAIQERELIRWKLDAVPLQGCGKGIVV